ncbi:MAG: DUF2191 domain-containing protein [Verrucomicrobia bacterium]|nr:DUF2191 domain-containing protein [Verrucomicrobiota bacterium]MCH8513477.1 DUF2191 domain-containing protein [Kiritimatiellia bacterium]
MKTTLNLSDPLLLRAKALAKAEGTTLRSLTEEGLTRVLEARTSGKPTKIQPITFKGKGLSNKFESASWADIRDAAYEMGSK